MKLEELQEAQIRKALEPPEPTVTLSEAEQAAALDLLKDPHLLDRILTDFERCGVVGEETNKLVGYVAAERASYALKLLQSEGELAPSPLRARIPPRASWSRTSTRSKGR